jgi:two-component system cell cycle sensor histidine kinase/response regulator CckA
MNAMYRYFSSALSFLVPPLFTDDEEKIQLNRILFFTSAVTLLGSVFVLIMFIQLPDTPFSQYSGSLVRIIGTILIILHLRKGNSDLSAYLFIGTIWISFALSIPTTGGVYALGYRSGFLLLIFASSLLIGFRAAFFVAALSIIYGLLVAIYYPSTEFLTFEYYRHPLRVWFLNTVLIVITLVFIRYSISTIRESLSKARRELKERIKAENSFQQSEQNYREVFNATNEAIFIEDPETGGILDVNESAVRMYGFASKQEMLPYSFESLKVYDEKFPLSKAQTFLTEAINGKPQIFEWLSRKKNGELFWTEISLRGSEIGGKNRVLAVVRDISERKRAEEKERNLQSQLQQANKLESLGTLAAGIAHDFNNILSVIIGYTGMLERSSANPAIVKRNTSAVTTAAFRGAELVKQLLTFARKTEFKVEMVLLNDIIREISKLLEGTLPKTILISLELDDALPPIAADATQLNQILLNLCVNARDAMPNGGYLTITTASIPGATIRSKFHKAVAKEYVKLSVRDTGIGMDEKVLQRLFEPFFTTKGIGEGTGLGLSLVFSIVESHNGFIDVQSEPQKGTTFTLYFPLPQEQTEQIDAVEESAAAIDGGNETILLVEDEVLLREITGSTLEANGYTILTAEDGEKAVEIYSQNHHNIQLVLSDMGLPKFNGYELFKKLRAIHPGIRMIIASGYIDPAEKSILFKEGIKDFIQKPYNEVTLLRSIRSILDMS